MNDKELIQALRYCGDPDNATCNDCCARKLCEAEPGLPTDRMAANRLEALIAENDQLTNQLIQRNDQMLKLRDQMPKWVSVNERLPEHGKTVLVYCDSVTIESGKTVHIGSCDRLCGIPCWFLRNEIGIASYPNRDWSVTRWMPLPEPPSAEGSPTGQKG